MESRGKASGAGLGDGASSQKQQKAVESSGLNRFVYIGGSSRDCLLQRGRRRLRFVFLKGRHNDFRFLRIGAVNRLAVMPKRGLGKPFRHPDNLCPFRPCVAVAVQRHARHARPLATAAKPAGPVVGRECGQLREQCAGGRQLAATRFPAVLLIVNCASEPVFIRK